MDGWSDKRQWSGQIKVVGGLFEFGQCVGPFKIAKVWMVHNVAADQKCILAQNHLVLYNSIAGFLIQFFDRLEASVKI